MENRNRLNRLPSGLKETILAPGQSFDDHVLRLPPWIFCITSFFREIYREKSFCVPEEVWIGVLQVNVKKRSRYADMKRKLTVGIQKTFGLNSAEHEEINQLTGRKIDGGRCTIGDLNSLNISNRIFFWNTNRINGWFSLMALLADFSSTASLTTQYWIPIS